MVYDDINKKKDFLDYITTRVYFPSFILSRFITWNKNLIIKYTRVVRSGAALCASIYDTVP